jgi:hypothetical protein
MMELNGHRIEVDRHVAPMIDPETGGEDHRVAVDGGDVGMVWTTARRGGGWAGAHDATEAEIEPRPTMEEAVRALAELHLDWAQDTPEWRERMAI